MPTTQYKGYSVPTTGTEENTWGDEINQNSFAVIDRNVGGISSISLTNINVNLTTEQSQSLILRLSGTLTGNVLITTQCQGLTIVENNASGAFSVSFTNGVGDPVVLSNGSAFMVVTDATNGTRIDSNNVPEASEFPSGTLLLFQQTNAPPGWTKQTTHNNKGLRVVSGTASSGGSASFSSVFTSRTPAGSVSGSVSGTCGATTLTVSQIPAHTHTYNRAIYSNSPTGSGASRYDQQTTDGTTSSTGGGGSHTHTWSGSLSASFTGSAMDFALAYVDIIICAKD